MCRTLSTSKGVATAEDTAPATMLQHTLANSDSRPSSWGNPRYAITSGNLTALQCPGFSHSQIFPHVYLTPSVWSLRMCHCRLYTHTHTHV